MNCDISNLFCQAYHNSSACPQSLQRFMVRLPVPANNSGPEPDLNFFTYSRLQAKDPVTQHREQCRKGACALQLWGE